MSLEPWIEQVQPAWIDYNGHLSEAYYVLVMGHATDSFLDQVGMDEGYRVAHSASVYTVEAHIRYLDQIGPGETLEVRTSLIGATGKLLHLWHELWSDDRLRATEEILGLHVDSLAARSSAFPAAVAATLAGLLVDPPPEASRNIRPLGG